MRFDCYFRGTLRWSLELSMKNKLSISFFQVFNDDIDNLLLPFFNMVAYSATWKYLQLGNLILPGL